VEGLLKELEAAIGIEAINKGFAILAKLFAQVVICSPPLILLMFALDCPNFHLC